MLNHANFSQFVIHNYHMASEDLQYNSMSSMVYFYNTFMHAFWSLKVSVSIHCDYMEKSNQHSLQNFYFNIKLHSLIIPLLLFLRCLCVFTNTDTHKYFLSLFLYSHWDFHCYKLHFQFHDSILIYQTWTRLSRFWGLLKTLYLY